MRLRNPFRRIRIPRIRLWPLVLLLTIVAVFGTPTTRLHFGPFTLDTSQQRAAQIIIAFCDIRERLYHVCSDLFEMS